MGRMSDLLTVDALPALPAALVRVLPLLCDPASSWDDVERVVRHDQALTAAVLRLANSAAYGAPGRRFDLRSALVRVGRTGLRQELARLKMSSVLGGANAAFGLQTGEMWRGALAGALAAEEIAAAHHRSLAGTAFLCALLRDIGKLALNVGYGERYGSMVAEFNAEGRTFVEAERLALGFDHAQLGAEMARRWGLPPEVADAIEHHHAPPTPSQGSTNPLTDLVHAADAVCRWMGPGVGTDGMSYTFDTGVQERLGVDRHRVEAVVTAVFCRLKDIEQPMDTCNGVAA